MESYQWQYQPTPEELKKNKRNVRITEVTLYFVSLFFIGLYFDTRDFFLTSTFAILYIIVLISWHFSIKKKLILSRTAYTIDEQGINITNLQTNSVDKIQWEKIESFSQRPYFTYSKNDGHLYIATGKTRRGKNQEIYKFSRLMVTDGQREKVINILKTKLTEWNG